MSGTSKPLPNVMEGTPSQIMSQDTEAVYHDDNQRNRKHQHSKVLHGNPGSREITPPAQPQRTRQDSFQERPSAQLRMESSSGYTIREDDRTRSINAGYLETLPDPRIEHSVLPPTKKSMRTDERYREPKPRTFGGMISSMKNSLESAFYYDPREEQIPRPQRHHAPHEHGEPRRPREELYQEIDQLRNRNAQLQDDLNKAHGKVGKFIQSADRMQKTMDNKELFLGGQALDDEVKNRFLSLLSQIRTWSSKLERGPILTQSAVGEALATQFELVAPGCLTNNSRWWESGKRSRALIRGWLGYVLVSTVFRTRSGFPADNNDAFDEWMGETVQNSVAAIEDRFVYAVNGGKAGISMRNLHDWRALTLGLLSKVDLGPVAGKELHRFIDTKASEIMSVTKAFIPDDRYEEMLNGLMSIIDASIYLSQFLRKQRAFWWAIGPRMTSASDSTKGSVRERDQFYPGYMEDDSADGEDDDMSADSGKRVELYLAPGLLKRGNIDGEGYEQQTCIVPMLVKCC